MFWLFYTVLEIIIWNPHVRQVLFGTNPVLQMGASLMNDVIWFPLAVALPVFIVLKIRHVCQRIILRDGLVFIFIVMWIVCAVNYNLLFRMQFLFMLIFVLMWGIQMSRTREINLKTCFFVLALLGMIVHYNTQLVPLSHRYGPAQLSVMTFNFNTKGAYDDERTIQFIHQRIPDIVFLQELTKREQQFISRRLGELYPYFVAPAANHGKNDVMILSRKTILYADQVRLQTPFSDGYHSANHAVIDFNGHRIHLLNCHLTHAYKQLGAHLNAPDSLDLKNELWQSYQRHVEEARLLADYCTSLDGPLIVAGDFNDTPNSKIYALFNKHFNNAYAAAGWGLGSTFGEWAMSKKLPRFLNFLACDLLRIDNIFFSQDFLIKSAHVEKISAFDHRPQLVTAILK